MSVAVASCAAKVIRQFLELTEMSPNDTGFIFIMYMVFRNHCGYVGRAGVTNTNDKDVSDIVENLCNNTHTIQCIKTVYPYKTDVTMTTMISSEIDNKRSPHHHDQS